MSAHPPSHIDRPESLKRSLGLVDVTAIGLNGVIGTGIFFLPGIAAAMLGPASVVTFLISAVLCTLLVLCFAEVGSRFHGTGGPMLYTQVAFGDHAGFLVGWIVWIIRITSWGALANAMVTATVTLVPAAQEYRVLIITGLLTVLTAINIAGVTMGSRVNVFFTAAKLIPIALFLAVGVFHVQSDLFVPFAPQGLADVAPATLVILYAFVGFEVLTIPAGEMRKPERSVPRALLLTMSIVTGVYLLVWMVCTGTLSTLAGSENPVAEAATAFMGAKGGFLVAFGIFLSVLGVNAGQALVAPRCLYGLAHLGYLPRFFGWVHPRTHTPVPAIVITAAISLVIALTGSFVELAVISVVARFAQYIPTCLAVLYFRWKRPDDPPEFRVPGGPIVPVVAILLCGWLLIESEPRHLLWGSVALVSGLLFYIPMLLAQQREPTSRS